MKLFIKFVGIGGISTLFQYVLLIAFVELVQLNPIFASVLSYLISSVFNYLANYYFTFRSNQKHISSVYKFVLIVTCSLVLSACSMYVLHELFGLHYLIAQATTTLIVLIWNFLSQKLWVFK